MSSKADKDLKNLVGNSSEATPYFSLYWKVSNWAILQKNKRIGVSEIHNTRKFILFYPYKHVL